MLTVVELQKSRYTIVKVYCQIYFVPLVIAPPDHAYAEHVFFSQI